MTAGKGTERDRVLAEPGDRSRHWSTGGRRVWTGEDGRKAASRNACRGDFEVPEGWRDWPLLPSEGG